MCMRFACVSKSVSCYPPSVAIYVVGHSILSFCLCFCCAVRNPVGNDAAPPVAAGDRVATGDANENVIISPV